MLQEADMTTCSKARSWEELKFFKISYPHYLCTAVMEKNIIERLVMWVRLKLLAENFFFDPASVRTANLEF